LKFVGLVRGEGPAKLRLEYGATPDGQPKAEPSPQQRLVTLRFSEAEPSKLPEKGLEQLWTRCRMRSLAEMEGLVPDFTFASFARNTLAEKNPLVHRSRPPWPATHTESAWDGKRLPLLVLGYFPLAPSARGAKFDSTTVFRGDVAEIEFSNRPWQKMMKGEKPDPEPLAAVVPFDHYLVTFKTVAALAECGDLLDQWGGNLTQLVTVRGHDHRKEGIWIWKFE
jgi:hypothetical protein